MISTYIFSGILIIISLVIQGHSSFDVLRIAGVKPDLLFIAIVYYGYSFGSFYGEVTGFISGLLHDAVSNSPLGLLAFPKMAVGYFIGFFNRSIIRSNVLSVFIIMFLASIAKGLLTFLISLIFSEVSLSSIISIILPESFYNAVLAPILFILFD